MLTSSCFCLTTLSLIICFWRLRAICIFCGSVAVLSQKSDHADGIIVQDHLTWHPYAQNCTSFLTQGQGGNQTLFVHLLSFLLTAPKLQNRPKYMVFSWEKTDALPKNHLIFLFLQSGHLALVAYCKFFVASTPTIDPFLISYRHEVMLSDLLTAPPHLPA